MLPRRQDVIALVSALLGVFLLVTHGNIHSLQMSKIGLFWSILSILGAMAYALLPRTLVKKYDSPSMISWGMVIAGIIFQFIQPVTKNPPKMNLTVLAAVLFIIVIGTSLSYLMLLSSLKYIPADTMQLLTSFEPIVVFLLSVFVLGQSATILDIIGTALVLVTVVIQTRK
jgi:drug/metabolite transporter (DMT)-like permease